MAVPKVAVIAIVAIIAVPILLGYAMNFDEITVKEYKSAGDTVNVTPLLQTGTDWSIANGDPYQMNANSVASMASNFLATPIYNNYSAVKTSIPMVHSTGSLMGATVYNLPTFILYEVQFDYTKTASEYVTATLYNSSNSVLGTIQGLCYLRWDGTAKTISWYGTYGTSITGNHDISYTTLDHIVFSLTGLSSVVYADNYYKSTNTSYADLADGYYFQRYSKRPNPTINSGWDLELPDNTTSATLSIDLDSITDSNYEVRLERNIRLIKTTTDGVVSWRVHCSAPYSSTVLYYDPNISNNTYQLVFTDRGSEYTNGYYYNNGHIQFRYIGSWQKTIGQANYYQTYDIDYYNQDASQIPVLDSIKLSTNDDNFVRTPTIRIDSALFRAFEYSVIEDITYNPAAFKTNPATTISSIEQYGDSITFGGNTYTVTDGNITLGTHQIPIRNMVFDSVPHEDSLDFDNRINGTVVSTTAAPSTITFNGKWGASISTVSMNETSVTKTEWVAGSFGWDGIDHNFLIAGLVTSLGAFIGVGIYMRKSGTSLWPLLLVCGGAALMFFLML